MFKLILISFTSIILTACAGTMPSNLGVKDQALSPCPNKPNCVSSFEETKQHSIAPLELTSEASWQALIETLNSIENCQIITQQDNYIHSVFTSKIMGFADDVEFFKTQNKIHMRSASRLGYSDLGVNRERLESIRQQLKQNMKK